MRTPGTTFSGAYGPFEATLEDASSGVPHGQVRATTAGEIRAAGGSVTWVPQLNRSGTATNLQHVNIVEGPGETSFGALQKNPLPGRLRFPP